VDLASVYQQEIIEQREFGTHISYRQCGRNASGAYDSVARVLDVHVIALSK
jgi:hypothetical protein